MPRRAWVFLFVMFVTVAADQGSKLWAHGLPTNPPDCAMADLVASARPSPTAPCQGIPRPLITGFWDWQLSMNTGSAFSMFAGGAARTALSVLAAIAIAALGVAAWRTRPDERLRRGAYALLAGGALGNLIDRVRLGAVTDFVHWHAGTHHWPVFNVADVALVIGVVALLASGLRSNAKLATAPDPA